MPKVRKKWYDQSCYALKSEFKKACKTMQSQSPEQYN